MPPLKIIAVLRYVIAGLCQNHKKAVGSRQGAARDKNGKPELVEKLARRLGPGHVVNLCFIVVLFFPPCSPGVKWWCWKMPISPPA